MDVDEYRNMISEFSDLQLFDEKCSFYYDETGNVRKFRLTENGVNAFMSMSKGSIDYRNPAKHIKADHWSSVGSFHKGLSTSTAVTVSPKISS